MKAKTVCKSITPAKGLNPTKVRKLIFLLSELKEETLRGHCTWHNSSIVECCDYLLEMLEGDRNG